MYVCMYLYIYMYMRLCWGLNTADTVAYACTCTKVDC